MGKIKCIYHDDCEGQCSNTHYWGEKRVWSPGIAMVLSFLMPGVGQIYRGKKLYGGLLWLGFIIIGYVCFVIPGIVLHLLCVIAAGKRRKERSMNYTEIEANGNLDYRTVEIE